MREHNARAIKRGQEHDRWMEAGLPQNIIYLTLMSGPLRASAGERSRSSAAPSALGEIINVHPR